MRFCVTTVWKWARRISWVTIRRYRNPCLGWYGSNEPGADPQGARVGSFELFAGMFLLDFLER